MAMNPRLLRPLASGKNPETLAWISGVIAAGSSVNTATANAVDAFVSGCKSDGIWDAIKACCILCGPDTLAGALVPLVGAAPTNNNFVSGDYNRLTGLVGDGSTKYLDANRDGDDDPQDDQHASVYVSSAHSQAGAGGYIASGDIAGTPGATDLGRSGVNTANLFARAQCQNAGSVSGEGTATGFMSVTRSSGASFVARASGTSNTITIASQTPHFNDFNVFRFPDGNGVTNARLAFYSIGESLDLAALDARVSALITAIGNS